MSKGEVPLVDRYAAILRRLLADARATKSQGSIEPPLSTTDVKHGLADIADLSALSGAQAYAGIETACRELFYKILINSPQFGDVWNLFDIISLTSDQGLCEPSLIFWLVEELLDSQTIDGCRTVFDYLDSRREMLTARNFKAKNLVILRSCNELLRRLSRAEDTVFCGRVFSFLFQSFPLGDKSSVNLRGEYHVENVTTFEDVTTASESEDQSKLEASELDKPSESQEVEMANTIDPEDKKPNKDSGGDVKEPVLPESQELNSDQLYTTFWSLQENFSQPTSLFDESKLKSFKNGLQTTLRKFKEIQQDRDVASTAKPQEDGSRGVKRKRDLQDNDLSNAFNPKYLTSRDLFDLELSDPSFRRHILVQSLVILEFLLGLSSKAKKKLEQMSNRSVLYAYTLSDDNVKWALDMRHDVAMYLQEGPEGKFFYRMVATVLSRDKNWTHWKAEACPPISKPAVPATDFREALAAAQRACTNKRLKPKPMGSLDLDFLSHTGGDEGLQSLKDAERYDAPALESFERPLADIDFDLEMARTGDEKQVAEDAKASTLWRTLRIAAKSRLQVLDKVDDGRNIKVLFESPPEANVEEVVPVTNGEAEKGEDLVTAEVVAPEERSEDKSNGVSSVPTGTPTQAQIQVENTAPSGTE